MDLKIDSRNYATTRLGWRYRTEALSFEVLNRKPAEIAKIQHFMDAIGSFCGVLLRNGFWRQG